MSTAERHSTNGKRFPNRPTDNVRLTEPFAWNDQRADAALLLANGNTRDETAAKLGVNRGTIFEWLRHPDFSCEVDRLSVMVGFANRAERLRRAARVLESRLDENGVLRSDKDSLDWVKYIQSETDGAKVDLSKLAELFTGDTEQPSPPQLSSSLDPSPIEVEATDIDHLALPDAVSTIDDDHNP